MSKIGGGTATAIALFAVFHAGIVLLLYFALSMANEVEVASYFGISVAALVAVVILFFSLRLLSAWRAKRISLFVFRVAIIALLLTSGGVIATLIITFTNAAAVALWVSLGLTAIVSIGLFIGLTIVIVNLVLATENALHKATINEGPTDIDKEPTTGNCRSRKLKQTDWNKTYKGAQFGDTPVDMHLQNLVEQLPLGAALDLGCGTGQNAIWLAEKGWLVDGVDIAKRAIAIAKRVAKERKLDISFAVADVLNWQPNREYNLVYITWALPESSDSIKVLNLATNALRPGGKLLITEIDASASRVDPVAWKDSELNSIDEVVSTLNELKSVAIYRAELIISDHGHGRAWPSFVVEATKNMHN